MIGSNQIDASKQKKQCGVLNLNGQHPTLFVLSLALSLSSNFSAQVGGCGDNLGAQFLTVRSGVGDFVTLLSAHNCCAEGGLLREDLQVATCRQSVLNFAGAE